jgi:hypothetical protein
LVGIARGFELFTSVLSLFDMPVGALFAFWLSFAIVLVFPFPVSRFPFSPHGLLSIFVSLLPSDLER